MKLLSFHLHYVLIFVSVATSQGFISPAIRDGGRRAFTKRTITTTTQIEAYPPRKNGRGQGGKNKPNKSEDDDNYDPILDEPSGRRGDGRNWIEKSSPIGIGKLGGSTPDSSIPTSKQKDAEADGNYDLGMNGISFQTGALSTRMYDALMSVALKRFPPGTTSLPSELEDVYKLYAMDITAKESVKAALDQNGMELASMNQDDPTNEDEGMWGDVESVQLIDMETGKVENENEIYESLDDAVEKGDWVPGQSFNFIVRNVSAKLKEMDISDLLTALDPEGSYREQAKEKGITLPDEDVVGLKELGKDCERRAKVAPWETQTNDSVYKGDSSKGYNIINRSDLLVDSRNRDGTENTPTLLHVMDALVNHGCLIVDLSDGGISSLGWNQISQMWEESNKFFDTIENDENAMNSLPKMEVAEGAGSPNAVVGFASYSDASMQFLETRIIREKDGSKDVVPAEFSAIVGTDGVNTFIDAFSFMTDVGKDVVRIAVAAANMEYDAFLGHDTDEKSIENENSSDLPFILGLTFEEAEVSGIGFDNESDEDEYVAADRLSSEAALNMVEELIDDSTHFEGNMNQGAVSMSPHRICKYVDRGKPTDKKNDDKKQKETFGAHTDTSFVTIVPVASVSGLEIFDESANKWFRPELLARMKWEKEAEERGLDPSLQTETIVKVEDGEEKEISLPWHARYMCMMPGELLQVCTRNEIPAAVHRVVSKTNGKARISSPVLLRARAGIVMDVKKYFGKKEAAGSLMNECDGMSMQEIHDTLQPSSYRS